MHSFRKPLATLTAALSLAACGPQEPSPPEAPPAVEDSRTPAQREAERTPYALEEAFAQAAREFGVPVELLKAYAYAETRWEMVRGHEEFEGLSPAHGLMALRGSQITEGARRAGVSEEAVRTRPDANIRAAAALLSAHADELSVDRADLGAWAPAAVKLSGISHPGAQAQFIHQAVYGVMREGAEARTPDGRVAVSLPRTEVQAKFEAPGVQAMAAGPDYAASIWRASSNFNARPAGTDISMVVIHTCEGGYSGCWSWQVNPDSNVSAHYVVNESGSEVTQLVRETDRGWHVAASYDCTLNGSVLCGLNGSSVNNFSVGIEHAGYASQASFPAGQIDASAKLTCDITRDRTVVRDSYHIVAHGRLQPYNRTDPGPNWPWSTYINKVKSYCGDTSGSGVIIDSNNSNNDTSQYYVEVAGTSWVSSTNVGGYYGSGYFVAPTAPVSEPVTFWFHLPAAATKTVDGWWTSATDRSTEAPYNVFNATGTKLGTVYVNQQANGGAWNTIGTFNFSAGWNKVQVSRWTVSGAYVVADAVRVR
jgi:N-acetyl-anhydromuramyl-L-alanine amidase AmpD